MHHLDPQMLSLRNWFHALQTILHLSRSSGPSLRKMSSRMGVTEFPSNRRRRIGESSSGKASAASETDGLDLGLLKEEVFLNPAACLGMA